MKWILQALIFFSSYQLCSQEHSTSLIYKIGKIEGIIFNQDGIVLPQEEFENRLNLSISYALKIDSMAYIYIRDTLQLNLEQCPNIIENWENYIRQYVYFIDKSSGHRIIRVQFVWKEWAIRSGWKNSWMEISDLCTHVWEISFDEQGNNFVNVSIF